MTAKLGLYILSYRRAAYLKEALESALSQTYRDVDIIVSDNTPDDSVRAELEEFLRQNNRIKFVRRHPSVAALDHFTLVLNECRTYEYAMLFHDDDILLPTALEEMVTALETRPTYTAAACNAYFMESTRPTRNLFNPYLTEYTEVTGPHKLIKRYTLRRLSHTPFPAYIYRTRLLDGIRLDPEDGGKYSDVSFLVKLVERGPFIWLGNPLMYYRRHGENDSGVLDLQAIFTLCRFFFKKSPAAAPYIGLYLIKYVAKKLLVTSKTGWLRFSRK